MSLSPEELAAIAELDAEGLSVRQIAAATAIHRSSVHRALKAIRAGVTGEPPAPAPVTPAAATWLPPADDATVWREEQVGYGPVRVRLRTVRLWGRLVEVDELGQVFCTGCLSLVDVATLARPGNGHRPSPWPTHPAGELLEMDDGVSDCRRRQRELL